MDNLKAVFDTHLSHLEFDAAFVKKLQQYTIDFVNKNEDHMEFFGGVTTGVQIVKFTDIDRNTWFFDILKADDLALENDIYQLPSINPAFHVSSDVFNLSVTYVIHRLMTSAYLTDEQKLKGITSVGLILHFKFLTSLLNNYFKYPADPEVAAATYAQLSEKFGLKQKGNWYALLESRVLEAFRPNGLHYNKLFQYNSDKKIVDCINDLQGRVRSYLKNIYSVFMKVSSSGKRIASTSQMSLDKEGEEIYRDAQSNLVQHTRYIQSIIGRENTFIKTELITLIGRIRQTMSEVLLEKALRWMSNNYNQPGAAIIDELISETLVHSFRYLSGNKTVARDITNITDFVSRLCGVYTSSRSTDPALISIRDKAETIVKISTGIKHQTPIAAVRTGILIYICLRAFTKKYFDRGG